MESIYKTICTIHCMPKSKIKIEKMAFSIPSRTNVFYLSKMWRKKWNKFSLLFFSKCKFLINFLITKGISSTDLSSRIGQLKLTFKTFSKEGTPQVPKKENLYLEKVLLEFTFLCLLRTRFSIVKFACNHTVLKFLTIWWRSHG